MKNLFVVVTGTSTGIGKAIAELFIDKGHEVVGIDRLPSSIQNPHYLHIQKHLTEIRYQYYLSYQDLLTLLSTTLVRKTKTIWITTFGPLIV